MRALRYLRHLDCREARYQDSGGTNPKKPSHFFPFLPWLLRVFFLLLVRVFFFASACVYNGCVFRCVALRRAASSNIGVSVFCFFFQLFYFLAPWALSSSLSLSCYLVSFCTVALVFFLSFLLLQFFFILTVLLFFFFLFCFARRRASWMCRSSRFSWATSTRTRRPECSLWEALTKHTTKVRTSGRSPSASCRAEAPGV